MDKDSVSQDRACRESDSDSDPLENDVEFVELDASSLSTASSSPRANIVGQLIGTDNNGARRERPASDSSVAAGAAAAAPLGSGRCNAAAPSSDGAGVQSAVAAAAGADAPPRVPAAVGAASSEQDRLLQELVGRLAKQGSGSRGKEEPDIDADIDYIRIEPHEAHENAMCWSNSSVGSRFSFLIRRTQSDESSDAEDPAAEELPSPAGAPQDVDDREESDQLLPLEAADRLRQAGARATLAQQQQQQWRWWQLDGVAPVAAAAAAGLANPVPADGDGDDPALPSSRLRQPVRHYKHDKNSRVNGVLSAMAAVTLVLAVGIGIGHCIGSAREAALQQQIRDDQDVKLRELREDLLMCLRKQEDISQTITKLNEIEAILVDAEHWRNEYEELLKLKVQAEDSWRGERAELVGHLEQTRVELGRVKTCHHDSESLSRQELKLDDVHAKLQAALDHKERQAFNQQLVECKANVTARDEATRGLKAAIDSKNRAIVLLKEQLLDRERELVKVTSSCATAAVAATSTADGVPAAAAAALDPDRQYAASSSHQDEKCEGLAACQRQLLRSLEHASHLESSLQDAQSQLKQRKQLQQPKLHSYQKQLDDLARDNDVSSSSSCNGGAGLVGTMAAAQRSGSAACARPSPVAESCGHAVHDKGGEAMLRRCARMVLAAREKSQQLSTSTSASVGSPGQLALDRSLRLFAAAAALDSRSSPPLSGINGREGSGSREMNGGGERSGESESDTLHRLYRGTRSAVEELLGAARSTLRVANSSLHALANTSTSLLRKAGQSAADASRKWNVTEKVSAAAAGVQAGMRDVATILASALRTATGKAKEAASSAAEATMAAEGGSGSSNSGNAAAAADEVAAAAQKPPVVNASQFWAEFKDLRQLVSNFTERAHLPGEGERTYGAVAAFLRRYNVTESALPGGSEWKAWCSCQLAWWTGRLQSLAGVVDCSGRLADWQADATQDTETGRATAVRATGINGNAGDGAKYGNDDLVAPEWIFERAAEREFLRDTPDDWYWRKVKDVYSKMYELFGDARSTLKHTLADEALAEPGQT